MSNSWNIKPYLEIYARSDFSKEHWAELTFFEAASQLLALERKPHKTPFVDPFKDLINNFISHFNFETIGRIERLKYEGEGQPSVIIEQEQWMVDIRYLPQFLQKQVIYTSYTQLSTQKCKVYVLGSNIRAWPMANLVFFENTLLRETLTSHSLYPSLSLGRYKPAALYVREKDAELCKTFFPSYYPQSPARLSIQGKRCRYYRVCDELVALSRSAD